MEKIMIFREYEVPKGPDPARAIARVEAAAVHVRPALIRELDAQAASCATECGHTGPRVSEELAKITVRNDHKPDTLRQQLYWCITMAIGTVATALVFLASLESSNVDTSTMVAGLLLPVALIVAGKSSARSILRADESGEVQPAVGVIRTKRRILVAQRVIAISACLLLPAFLIFRVPPDALASRPSLHDAYGWLFFITAEVVFSAGVVVSYFAYQYWNRPAHLAKVLADVNGTAEAMSQLSEDLTTYLPKAQTSQMRMVESS